MKKRAMLFLALMLCCTSAAYAYDIEVNIDSFNISVSEKSDVNTKRPTVQLLDADKKTVIYMGEGKSEKNADKTYTFTFDTFGVPKTLPTGSYCLRVGGEGLETQEKIILFINNNDKSNALNAVAEAADKLAAVIENADKLGVERAAAEKLGADGKAFVNRELGNIDVKNDGSVKDTDEKYNIFYSAYQKACEAAAFIGSDKTEIKKVTDAPQGLKLDRLYYDKLSDKSAVAAIIAGNNYSSSVTYDELIKDYDGAVLACTVSQLDWSTGKAAIKYYNEKGVINADLATVSALSSSEQTNVYKNLKALGLTDYRLIPDKLKELAKKAQGSSSSSSSGGGGGGGGSVKGGGASVTAPVPQQPTSAENNTGTPNKREFPDLDGYDWAKEAINALRDEGVINGDESGSYNPGESVTREAFTKIVVGAFSLYDENAEIEFKDISRDAWYYKYVASAAKNGVIRGISDDEFGCGQSITRQDMAVILERIFKMAKCSADGVPASFIDSADISEYAREAADTLSRAGILNGMEDGAFYPHGTVTRAETAKAVYELKKLTERN